MFASFLDGFLQAAKQTLLNLFPRNKSRIDFVVPRNKNGSKGTFTKFFYLNCHSFPINFLLSLPLPSLLVS